MSRLIDKLSILLICLAGFCMADDITVPVAALLVSVALSSLVQMLTGVRAALTIALGSALCGTVPVFFCALPLMLYDALREKKWWLTIPAALILFRLRELSSMQLLITAAAAVTAVILYIRSSHLEKAVGNLTQMRDKTAEANMQLSGQNLRLAEAYDNEIHLATMRERNRIAREIHDNVGHMLTRSLLQAGALIIINKDESLKEPLEGLKNTLNNAMTSIRESVHDLHDDSIDLKKLVQDSINAVDKRFTVRLEYDMSENVPGKIRLCMAGVVREGLSNVVKHSDGDRVNVVLREHPGFYQLMIEDNGSCGEIKKEGIGLRTMEERAESVGGSISFTNNNGFRIFMIIKRQGYENSSN